MSYKINGKEIPSVAIGTWAWGSGTNGSKIVFGSKSDPDTLKESFDIAFKNGFTLFDTAAVYGMGNAETLLAQFTDGKDFIFSDKYTHLKKHRKIQRKNTRYILAPSAKIYQGNSPLSLQNAKGR